MPQPKTPTAILEASGALKKNPQRRNNHEPEANPDKPEMPKHLDQIGKSKWQQICGELDRMGILSKTDALLIELLASNYSLWRESLATMQMEGAVVAGKRNPSDIIRRDCEQMLRSLANDLGIGPAARSKIIGPIDKEDDKPAIGSSRVR